MQGHPWRMVLEPSRLSVRQYPCLQRSQLLARYNRRDHYMRCRQRQADLLTGSLVQESLQQLRTLVSMRTDTIEDTHQCT